MDELDSLEDYIDDYDLADLEDSSDLPDYIDYDVSDDTLFDCDDYESNLTIVDNHVLLDKEYNHHILGANNIFLNPSIVAYPDPKNDVFNGCDFSQDIWEDMSIDDKLSNVNQLEHNIAIIQERDPIEIRDEDMDKFLDRFTGTKRYGYYDPNTNEIYINSSLLEDSSELSELIDTVAHEGYHGYQHACINGDAFYPDPIVVAEWKDNFKNYLDPNTYGFEAYYNQPVEVSAREMAEHITDSFYTQYAS